MNNNRQKVLIIDDSQLMVKVLTQILEDDYEILTANSGEQGLKTALAGMPDIILLDVVMGEMDGYEVCRRIKENSVTQNIPVIFISGLDNINDEQMGLEVGAIDYISKPFSETIVKIRVKNHLELKRHRDLLAALTSLDGLTGIYNRRHFDTCYQNEWTRAIKNKTMLSLMMIDIDYFKLYNDGYGHLEGDECLKRIAQAINYSIEKEKEFACRYGGEEFVCVMPETEVRRTINTANLIHNNVMNLKIPHKDSEVSAYVTISSGLGTITPNADIQPLHFIEQVDKLLYQAKRSGRNQIKYLKLN
ncbi:MAG: diguanylate cyclase [Hyphomonadaceae bacterium]|nr:diguanylate cyclase [Clostridia bacterium]